MKMRTVWIGLLLVMLSLRALVPTGFMPDPDALVAGSIGFAICDGHQAHAAAAQFTPSEISAEHDLLQALEPSRRDSVSRAPLFSSPSSVPLSEHGDICPFSAVLYLAVAAFIAIALLRVLAGICWHCAGFITVTCLVYLRTGSPLGPRAPPLTR